MLFQRKKNSTDSRDAFSDSATGYSTGSGEGLGYTFLEKKKECEKHSECFCSVKSNDCAFHHTDYK